MRLAFLVLALSSLAPALAAAQSAVVLVPEGPASRAELDRARSAVIEVLAERGIRLLRVPDGPECAAPECATELAERAGADLAVLVHAEPAENGLRARVQLLTPGSPPTEAIAPAAEAGLGAAAAAALEEALAVRTERRSGFLMVRTRPIGARVLVDGTLIGETPLRRMVRAGEHEVRITAPDGGATTTHTVEVRPLEETALDLRLGEGSEDDTQESRSPPARTEPSPFNWLLGGGLAIAGVIALVSPLQTLATEGQCVDELENVGCLERVQFGAQSGILLGVGLAALAAAVVVDVAAPIRVGVEASPTRGSLVLEGRF
jgi:hypothetical protein